MHSHAHTHTYTHTHTHAHTHVRRTEGHGCEKDNLEIIIEQVHLRIVSMDKILHFTNTLIIIIIFLRAALEEEVES